MTLFIHAISQKLVQYFSIEEVAMHKKEAENRLWKLCKLTSVGQYLRRNNDKNENYAKTSTISLFLLKRTNRELHRFIIIK